jgi:hypothetical protein
MQFTTGARKVAEAEWKIVEAVSDPHLSTVDQRKREVVEGPLKSIEETISVIQASRVKVSAMILEEERTYWLPVSSTEDGTPSAEEEPDARADGDPEAGETEGPVNAAANEKKEETRKVDQKPRSKYDFTEEQKAAMMARADEIGIREAAKEFSVPWQAIAQLKRREREKNGKPPVSKAQKPGSGRRRRKAEADAVSGLPAASANAGSLKDENAMLRKKLSELEARAEKLKKAILELM